MSSSMQTTHVARNDGDETAGASPQHDHGPEPSCHPTVEVRVGDRVDDIDIELAPLIEEIWKADIGTIMCCQENRPGVAWIQFWGSLGAEQFMAIVSGPYDPDIDSLYNRIRRAWDHFDGPPAGAWEYDTLPFDLAVEEEEVDGYIDEEPLGPPEFLFHVSIRFPRTDIPALYARMREHNLRSSQLTVLGYCDLCRAKEIELHNQLAPTKEQHIRACQLAHCKHPYVYEFPEQAQKMQQT